MMIVFLGSDVGTQKRSRHLSCFSVKRFFNFRFMLLLDRVFTELLRFELDIARFRIVLRIIDDFQFSVIV